MHLKNCLVLIIAVFALCGRPALSREVNSTPESRLPIAIQKLSGPIILDGLSDEEAWEEITPLAMVMQTPVFGNPPSEKTEVLIAFDDEYLYVAGRLYDTEPSKIQSPSKKRDYFEANTEWFGVIFDSFNDKENALGFFTTPAGLRWDGAIINDAEQRMPTDMPINVSWNTFWDVKTAVNGQGWFAEMRIPFSSLRFQAKDGRVIMGLLSWRWIPRKSELLTLPAIDPKFGQWAMWKPSQAREIVLEGVHSRNPLYITPYGLAGYGLSYDLNEEQTAYLRTNAPTTEAGLDLKYGLTSNLTLDLTLNTDFAQVEADDYQVNLTRFSLFFPEKRLFFLERAGIFDFNFGGYNMLFYSRRIGIYEEEAVRLYGGARLVGRLGSWDLGLLDMQTAAVETDEGSLPSENLGVLRLRRRVFNPYSYVGGIVTTRIGLDGSYNTVYGLDGTLRLSSEDYLLFNWAQSFESGEENDPVSLDPSRFRLTWDRRTMKGLGFNLGYSYAGEDYNPGLGFEMREDFSQIGNRLWYGWLPGEKSSLYSHNIFVDGFLYLRNDRSSLESLEIGPGWQFVAKSGWNGQFALKLYKESLIEEIEFFDRVDVPPGEYSFCGFEGYLQSPFGSLLSAMVTAKTGSFYDGWRTTIGLKPIWGISSDLSLSGYYEFNHVTFPDRNQRLTAQIAQIRLLATLSTKFSALAFVQQNSAADELTGNIRLRYNPREGIDLYLVYNENLNTHRRREIPNLPFSSNRAIMVKYSYTFVF